MTPELLKVLATAAELFVGYLAFLGDPARKQRTRKRTKQQAHRRVKLVVISQERCGDDDGDDDDGLQDEVKPRMLMN